MIESRESSKMSEEKIVTINEKIPTLKEQRKQRANRRLLFFLSFFFLLLLCIIYFQSPASHIKDFVVEGNVHLSEEQIIRQGKLSLGTSIWNLEKENIENRLTDHKEIASAVVKRQLPNTVKVTVREHERIGYLLLEEKYYPILETGQYLDQLSQDQLPADAPVLINFSEGMELTEIASELRLFPSQLLERISEIIYQPTETDPLSLVLFMTDGIEVHTSIQGFHENMLAYPTIVNEIDPEKKGILHMKMSPYFEELTTEEDEGIEGEG